MAAGLNVMPPGHTSFMESIRPVRALSFDELRAEIAAQPVEQDPAPYDSARAAEVRNEIRRRGGPVPVATAGQEDAPISSPGGPMNST